MKSGVEIRAALAQRVPAAQQELAEAQAVLAAAVVAAEADGYHVDRDGPWTIRDPSGQKNQLVTQAHMIAIGHARERVERAEYDAEHCDRLLRNLSGLNVERDYCVSEADLRRLGF